MSQQEPELTRLNLPGIHRSISITPNNKYNNCHSSQYSTRSNVTSIFSGRSGSTKSNSNYMSPLNKSIRSAKQLQLSASDKLLSLQQPSADHTVAVQLQQSHALSDIGDVKKLKKKFASTIKSNKQKTIDISKYNEFLETTELTDTFKQIIQYVIHVRPAVYSNTDNVLIHVADRLRYIGQCKENEKWDHVLNLLKQKNKHNPNNTNNTAAQKSDTLNLLINEYNIQQSARKNQSTRTSLSSHTQNENINTNNNSGDTYQCSNSLDIESIIDMQDQLNTCITPINSHDNLMQRQQSVPLSPSNISTIDTIFEYPSEHSTDRGTNDQNNYLQPFAINLLPDTPISSNRSLHTQLPIESLDNNNNHNDIHGNHTTDIDIASIMSAAHNARTTSIEFTGAQLAELKLHSGDDKTVETHHHLDDSGHTLTIEVHGTVSHDNPSHTTEHIDHNNDTFVSQVEIASIISAAHQARRASIADLTAEQLVTINRVSDDDDDMEHITETNHLDSNGHTLKITLHTTPIKQSSVHESIQPTANSDNSSASIDVADIIARAHHHRHSSMEVENVLHHFDIDQVNDNDNEHVGAPIDDTDQSSVDDNDNVCINNRDIPSYNQPEFTISDAASDTDIQHNNTVEDEFDDGSVSLSVHGDNGSDNDIIQSSSAIDSTTQSQLHTQRSLHNAGDNSMVTTSSLDASGILHACNIDSDVPVYTARRTYTLSPSSSRASSIESPPNTTQPSTSRLQSTQIDSNVSNTPTTPYDRHKKRSTLQLYVPPLQLTANRSPVHHSNSIDSQRAITQHADTPMTPVILSPANDQPDTPGQNSGSIVDYSRDGMGTVHTNQSMTHIPRSGRAALNIPTLQFNHQNVIHSVDSQRALQLHADTPMTPIVISAINTLASSQPNTASRIVDYGRDGMQADPVTTDINSAKHSTRNINRATLTVPLLQFNSQPNNTQLNSIDSQRAITQHADTPMTPVDILAVGSPINSQPNTSRQPIIDYSRDGIPQSIGTPLMCNDGNSNSFRCMSGKAEPVVQPSVSSLPIAEHESNQSILLHTHDHTPSIEYSAHVVSIKSMISPISQPNTGRQIAAIDYSRDGMIARHQTNDHTVHDSSSIHPAKMGSNINSNRSSMRLSAHKPFDTAAQQSIQPIPFAEHNTSVNQIHDHDTQPAATVISSTTGILPNKSTPTITQPNSNRQVGAIDCDQHDDDQHIINHTSLHNVTQTAIDCISVDPKPLTVSPHHNNSVAHTSSSTTAADDQPASMHSKHTRHTGHLPSSTISSTTVSCQPLNTVSTTQPNTYRQPIVDYSRDGFNQPPTNESESPTRITRLDNTVNSNRGSFRRKPMEPTIQPSIPPLTIPENESSDDTDVHHNNLRVNTVSSLPSVVVSPHTTTPSHTTNNVSQPSTSRLQPTTLPKPRRATAVSFTAIHKLSNADNDLVDDTLCMSVPGYSELVFTDPQQARSIKQQYILDNIINKQQSNTRLPTNTPFNKSTTSQPTPTRQAAIDYSRDGLHNQNKPVSAAESSKSLINRTSYSSTTHNAESSITRRNNDINASYDDYESNIQPNVRSHQSSPMSDIPSPTNVPTTQSPISPSISAIQPATIKPPTATRSPTHMISPSESAHHGRQPSRAIIDYNRDGFAMTATQQSSTTAPSVRQSYESTTGPTIQPRRSHSPISNRRTSSRSYQSNIGAVSPSYQLSNADNDRVDDELSMSVPGYSGLVFTDPTKAKSIKNKYIAEHVLHIQPSSIPSNDRTPDCSRTHSKQNSATSIVDYSRDGVDDSNTKLQSQLSRLPSNSQLYGTSVLQQHKSFKLHDIVDESEHIETSTSNNTHQYNSSIHEQNHTAANTLSLQSTDIPHTVSVVRTNSQTTTYSNDDFESISTVPHSKDNVTNTIEDEHEQVHAQYDLNEHVGDTADCDHSDAGVSAIDSIVRATTTTPVQNNTDIATNSHVHIFASTACWPVDDVIIGTVVYSPANVYAMMESDNSTVDDTQSNEQYMHEPMVHDDDHVAVLPVHQSLYTSAVDELIPNEHIHIIEHDGISDQLNTDTEDVNESTTPTQSVHHVRLHSMINRAWSSDQLPDHEVVTATSIQHNTTLTSGSHQLDSVDWNHESITPESFHHSIQQYLDSAYQHIASNHSAVVLPTHNSTVVTHTHHINNQSIDMNKFVSDTIKAATRELTSESVVMY